MLPEESLDEIRRISGLTSNFNGNDVNGAGSEAEFGAGIKFADSGATTTTAASTSSGDGEDDVTLEIRRWFREEDPEPSSGAAGVSGASVGDNGCAFDKAWQRLQDDTAASAGATEEEDSVKD